MLNTFVKRGPSLLFKRSRIRTSGARTLVAICVARLNVDEKSKCLFMSEENYTISTESGPNYK